MRNPATLSPRRLAAVAATAVLVATATVAGVAFAASGGDHPASTKAPTASAAARAPDAVVRAARTALQRLVADGTINQTQADAIERHVVAGFVDPAALIADGTVTRTQMLAVAHTLDLVKESMAHSSAGHPAGRKVAAPHSGARAPAAIVHAARTALQRLVANGTINQAQADAIERHVTAGFIDPAALIANGTVTHTQMLAVAHALTQVKRSAASHS
jgi:hypothetical protein